MQRRFARRFPGFIDFFTQFLKWARIAKKISLCVVTPLFLQQLPLLVVLNTFRHNLHIQAVCHGNNGIHQPVGIGIFTNLADEAPVNLQCFEREFL